MRENPKKIFVTGASGFLGRQLILGLVASGHQVVAASRGAVKLPGTIPQVIPTRGGILSFDGVLSGVDTIIHLAGMAHFGRSLLFPGWRGRQEFRRNLWQANVASVESLAGAAAQAGVRRLVYLSSIGAVASSSNEIIRHNTPPHPDSDYGKSKLAAEVVLHQRLDSSQVELAIVRPPLVYGPGNVANMRRLILLTASGLPIPLGSVHNRRSLVFSGNLVSLIEKILAYPKVPPWPILISDGEDLSTPELIRRLAGNLGRKARLVPVPLSFLKAADSILRTETYPKLCESLFLDMRPTQQFFGWAPPFSLQEGLRQTVVSYLKTVP